MEQHPFYSVRPAPYALVLLDDFLSIPMRISALTEKGHLKEQTTPLIEVGPLLGGFLLSSTTRTSRGSLARIPMIATFARRPVNEYWMSAGAPLIIVEQFLQRDRLTLPSGAKTITASPIRGAELHHLRMWAPGRNAFVWFVEISNSVDRDSLRRLRLHLARLHSEREALRGVLRLLALGQIPVVRNSPGSENLQVFLDRAYDIFFQKKRYGIESTQLLEAAYAIDDLISEDDRPALEQSLSMMRRSVSRKVGAIIDRVQGQAVRIDNANIWVEEGNVVDKRVSVDNRGGIFTGVAGADAEINSSFNTLANSDTAPELKAQLEQLLAAVATMCQQLSPEQAETAARDARTFMEEASSAAPRKGMLEAIGHGLITAAKLASTVGMPVIQLVTAIVGLF